MMLRGCILSPASAGHLLSEDKEGGMLKLAAAFVAGTICVLTSFAVYFIIGPSWLIVPVVVTFGGLAFWFGIDWLFSRYVGKELG